MSESVVITEVFVSSGDTKVLEFVGFFLIMLLISYVIFYRGVKRNVANKI